MIIKEFGHLAFNVADMERSLHFYCDILGLKKAFTIHVPENIKELMPDSPVAAMAGKDTIVYINMGNGAFLELFYPTPETNMESGGPNYHEIGYVHMSLIVDDLFEWDAYLREQGVQIDSDVHAGGDRTSTLWIRDPDGNRIELMKYSPDSPQVIHR